MSVFFSQKIIQILDEIMTKNFMFKNSAANLHHECQKNLQKKSKEEQFGWKKVHGNAAILQSSLEIS